MRRVDKIIIHCTATNPEQDFDVKDIDRWHKAKGWKGCGYHLVIKLDGTTEYGRRLNEVYVGGVDMDGKPSDTRTDEQKRALRAVVGLLLKDYPKATVHGHNEFNRGKACPSFNVKKENYGG